MFQEALSSTRSAPSTEGLTKASSYLSSSEQSNFSGNNNSMSTWVRIGESN